MFHDKPNWFKFLIVCTVCLLLVVIIAITIQHFFT